MMMTDCFSPACSGSKALPSLTFCGMMTSQSVSNSMGVVGSTLYSKGTHNYQEFEKWAMDVGSTLYSKGTHNCMVQLLTKGVVGSTLYSKGTHNEQNPQQVGIRVGSTLYSKGTHNTRKIFLR